MLEQTGDLVSIVVPVFNSAGTLNECLESARAQSYSNIEVIVVDDGSTDASFDLAASFANRDARFCVIRQENSGVGAARNNGLSHCSGIWVLFLDADDLLTTTCIEDLVVAADEETDMVVGSIQKFRTIFGRRIDAGVIRRANRTYFADGQSEPLNALDNILSLVTQKLLRRSVIVRDAIRFTSVPYSEDHRFGLAFTVAGDGLVRTIDKIVYLYRCGGVASTVRLYLDMDRISLSMLEYYRDVCAPSSRLRMDDAFCAEAPTRWLEGVLMHYSTCLPRKQVCGRCLSAIEEFSSLGSPYTFSEDASSYYAEWKKSRRIKIAAKRILRAIRLNSSKG